MVLTQGIGLGYLTAHLLARRAPTAATASSAGIQKALTTSQTRNYDAVVNARERMQKRNFSKKATKVVNPFATDEIRQRIGGYSIRKISTAEKPPQTFEEEQKELDELLKNEKW